MALNFTCKIDLFTKMGTECIGYDRPKWFSKGGSGYGYGENKCHIQILLFVRFVMT